MRIAHATLHASLRRAIKLVTRDRVLHAIRSADSALRRMGIASPRIAVSGLNPHAGEGGLFRRRGAADHRPGDRRREEERRRRRGAGLGPIRCS